MLQRALELAFAPVFGTLSALRHDRSVHPQGTLWHGELEITSASPLAPAAELLLPGGPRAVVARFSRMAGLPQRLGDVFGLAVRVLDAYGPGAHQDLLCNTSLDAPLAHRVFLPAPRWFAQPYSSCLAYRAGAGELVVGLLPPRAHGPGPSVAALADALGGGDVTFGVAVAGPLDRFAKVGELRLTTPHAGDVEFDPVRFCGGGLELTGALNQARRAVYRASRRGRGAPAVVPA